VAVIPYGISMYAYISKSECENANNSFDPIESSSTCTGRPPSFATKSVGNILTTVRPPSLTGTAKDAEVSSNVSNVVTLSLNICSPTSSPSSSVVYIISESDVISKILSVVPAILSIPVIWVAPSPIMLPLA